MRKSMEHLQIMGKPMENMNDFWENQGKIYSKYGEITRESMENQDPCFLANGRLADLIMVSWTKKEKESILQGNNCGKWIHCGNTILV